MLKPNHERMQLLAVTLKTHAKLRKRALAEKTTLKELTERLLSEALARKATA